MNIRETIEKWEQETLSRYASLSANTRGRERKEPLCDIRPEYQRDRDRILHSKSFRRLKQKTQVFLAPEGDHYRTRLTHTLEVSQIARTIAKALRLKIWWRRSRWGTIWDIRRLVIRGRRCSTGSAARGSRIISRVSVLWRCWSRRGRG